MLARRATQAGGPIMAQGVQSSTPIPDDDPDRFRRPGVDVVDVGDRPTVTVTGRVDRAKTTEVSDTVRGLIAIGVSELVVDLTHAWDSAVLLTILDRKSTRLNSS